MARLITEQTLEEIRQRIDIEELIGSRMTLKRSGSVFKACCPFHKEKTPSFVVDPVRRSYHCFGCGAHGDIFKFLMETDGMPFVEAVRTLAEKALVTLDTQVDNESAARQGLYSLHADLAAFYAQCLKTEPAAATARDYLLRRKLDAETIARFGIGFAPTLPRTLQNWGGKHGYSIEQFVEGGLLVPPRAEYPGDDYYDRFRGRLMFPIRDATGRVVGFSGRILDPAASPAKYVNSPETPIFRKGRILYALDLARANIVRSPRREAILCEGQIDVVRCHAHGFNTAIAAQGTACTEEHVALLKRYADSVILVYDGDTAGRKAALRTGHLFLRAGLPVRVAALPADQDPDSLLRDQGREAFQELLDGAASITTFQVKTLQDLETDIHAVDAVGRMASQVLEMLADCSKAVLRSHLLQEAAALLNLPERALEADLEQVIARRESGGRLSASAAPTTTPATVATKPPPAKRTADAAEGKAPQARPPAVSAPPVGEAEATKTPAFSLCELLLHHTDDVSMMKLVRTWLPMNLLQPPAAREIAEAAMAFHATGEDRLGELATTGNGEARRWIEKLARRESPLLHAQVITPCQAAEDIVARIWIDHFKRERQRLEKDDGEQGLRRLTLTKIIKQLAQQTAWPLRSAALIGELPVDGESPTPPPPV